MYLIDSDILIDYLRLHEKAIDLLNNLNRKDRAIAHISVFELLRGCNKKTQEAQINRFIKKFSVIKLDEKIAKKALEIYRIKRWTIGLGIVDSFIAATGILNKCELITRNVKHYQNIPGLKIKTPYF